MKRRRRNYLRRLRRAIFGSNPRNAGNTYGKVRVLEVSGKHALESVEAFLARAPTAERRWDWRAG